jgi:hypothetical protein
MNEQDRFYHSMVYQVADANVKAAIDAAYKAARRHLEAAGLPCANDDRAEAFVAQITRYVSESGQG